MSLSSPHLGYNKHTQAHTKLGLFILKQWKKNISIK